MCADDTKVYKGIHCFHDCYLLQPDLNSISTWAHLWQMELNPDKTKVLSIGNSHIEFEYTLQGDTIEMVSKVIL